MNHSSDNFPHMGIKTFLPNHKNHYNPINHSSDNFPVNP
jgi:hypothetical protein